jgi:hypothetical protein
MPENTKIKIKYKDFIQLENYQKSLINFLMKDAYVSCNGIYEGTKASYYFYESENHWMKITAKQPGEAGNNLMVRLSRSNTSDKSLIFTICTSNYTTIFSTTKRLSNDTEILSAEFINSLVKDSTGDKVSNYITFEGILNYNSIPMFSQRFDAQLSGGSDTPVLQEYFMYAQTPSSNIETYNESIGHYLYHGEYIASDLSYKFGVEVKQGVTSDVALLFRRGRSSEVNTLYISLRTDPGSSPSELAHQAFASGKKKHLFHLI